MDVSGLNHTVVPVPFAFPIVSSFLVVSPFAKRGFVDHTAYDTTSILKLITERFGLEPLPGVRQRMGNLANALD